MLNINIQGTSTDVSRFAGTFDHVFESTTAGITIQAPQLDVNTVAAGGGSMLFFRSGLFVAGPVCLTLTTNHNNNFHIL